MEVVVFFREAHTFAANLCVCARLKKYGVNYLYLIGKRVCISGYVRIVTHHMRREMCDLCVCTVRVREYPTKNISAHSPF